jgi:hypothetical protein
MKNLAHFIEDLELALELEEELRPRRARERDERDEGDEGACSVSKEQKLLARRKARRASPRYN